MRRQTAARDDRVSYETKRAHTKTASMKLGCAGQKDLVRMAMGQLVHLMSVSDSELRQADPARNAGFTPVTRQIAGTEHFYAAHPDDEPVTAEVSSR